MCEKLRIGLENLPFFSKSPEKLQSLFTLMDAYIREIILFNSAYNLTNTSDYDEIAVFHILDSLSGAKKIQEIAESLSQNPKEIKIADIGSGGGLPGIPLAAALPHYSFTLVERMDKRCAFLENAIAILGLKNAVVLKSEAERVAAESFDIATFRAFRPLDNKMTKTLLSLLKRGGFLAAYKAKTENIKSEMVEIKNLIPKYEIVSLSVPFLTDATAGANAPFGDGIEVRERNLVVSRKI